MQKLPTNSGEIRASVHGNWHCRELQPCSCTARNAGALTGFKPVQKRYILSRKISREFDFFFFFSLSFLSSC